MNDKYFFQNYTGTEIENLLDNINYILQWNGTSSIGDPTIWNKIASNYITLGTDQWNITGGKTFRGQVYFDASSTTRIYTTPSDGSDVVNKNYVDSNKGTKLYKHKISFIAGEGNKMFDIITTSSEEFRQSNLSSSSFSEMNLIADKIINVQGVTNTYNFVSVSYNGSKYFIRITKITFNLTSNTFSSEIFNLFDTSSVSNFSDTITEL